MGSRMVGGRVFWICLVTVLLLLANLASRSPSPTPRPGPIQRSTTLINYPCMAKTSGRGGDTSTKDFIKGKVHRG